MLAQRLVAFLTVIVVLSTSEAAPLRLFGVDTDIEPAHDAFNREAWRSNPISTKSSVPFRSSAGGPGLGALQNVLGKPKESSWGIE
ncbi:hypothetical protein HGRIS_014462 [Hohenbuehelia grisea]|uniref:Uncharacterized protein n=1 Tax=Hohenbuehelia grisea TaxID=104357 RepID=A0ABR3JUE0_9AGAR